MTGKHHSMATRQLIAEKRTKQCSFPFALDIEQVENFLALITTQNDCWLYGDNQTYGRVSLRWGNKRATHVMWFLVHGRWPIGLVLHSCDNPPCINPQHLREGNQSDNVLDAYKRRRRLPTHCKLSEQDVQIIRERRRNGELLQTIANDFNVTFENVHYICQRKTWKGI